MSYGRCSSRFVVVMVVVLWCCCVLNVMAKPIRNIGGHRKSKRMRKRMKMKPKLVQQYWMAFASIRNDAVWPTPKSKNASLISSTFGFRTKAICDCNDFHRGVDISGEIGDPVLASYNGTVALVTVHDGSRNMVVVLEHKFNTPVYFHGQKIKNWYTLYFHLDEQRVRDGDVIKAGEVIGRVGNSGARSSNPHLHHEVRLGTRCSLEYALDNPSSTCNTLGFDPHVHPLLIYPKNTVGKSSITLRLQKMNLHSSNGIVVRITTPDASKDVNRYIVIIRNTKTSIIRRYHILDYNLRSGFDPTSTKSLDKVDITKPYLQPIPFGDKDKNWMIDLIIPKRWFVFKRSEEKFVVFVQNIWIDEPKSISF